MLARMHRLDRLLLLALLASGACKPSAPAAPAKPKAADVPRTCSVRLPPRAGVLPTAAAAEPAPSTPSRAVVHVEVSLARIREELERAVAPRVADVRDQDIGVAGSLRYHADRGPFTLAVEGGEIVVRTPVRAHAEACAKGSCYASCDPEAVATARVPLALRADYTFSPSRVDVAFTRGCSLRALGGLLKIDVTPMVAARVRPSLARVEQEINARLPSPRPQVERLWAELARVRPLPLGACASPRPRGIVQGPMSGRGETLVGRFAVVAEPEIEAPCTATPTAAPPLPPLTQDPAMPDEDDLVVTMVTPLTRAAAGLEGDGPLEMRARAVVKRADVRPSGAGKALFDVELEGEVCGNVAVLAGLAWAKGADHITLTQAELAPGERERLEAAKLDPDALPRELARVVDVPALLPPSAVEALVPEIARGVSDASFALSAKVSKAEPRDVSVRGPSVAARVAVKGRIDISERAKK